MALARRGVVGYFYNQLPLFAARRVPWRKSIMIEYWAEQALPWSVGMTYKAVRTDRYKYIHWVARVRYDSGYVALNGLAERRVRMLAIRLG